ncbi:hypothetical protein TcasGA2_TC031767, partial [Tribolium castaneum]
MNIFVGTPLVQEEFEKLLLAVGGDWEELFKLGEEDSHPKIVIHSDKLIKPVAATGRKNLSLLRIQEEENFSDMEEEAGLVAQPVEPEKIDEIRRQFEEAAGGMRQEISSLKVKIKEKLMLLKQNRAKGEKLIRSLQAKIEQIKEPQEGGLITINLLSPVYPQVTPANQPEFEEFFNSGCWSDWKSQLELNQVFLVSEDMEQNSERGTEQNTKEQMHKNMGINIISNKLIRPIGRSRGVKDLKLLREPFIEDVYEEEATQPEMRLQQMVEEVATSFNGERIEEEIRVLKKKITDKAEALKRNRSFGEDLLRNLDEEEAEIRSNMEQKILNEMCKQASLHRHRKRQIIELVTPAYVGTPAGQEEFEELLLAVGGDWEELFNLGAENDQQEEDNHPKIVIHSDKVIKPIAATGRKNLSLLRIQEEENFSDMKEEEEAEAVVQPAEPEKIEELRNQFEEAAGGMREEISALKQDVIECSQLSVKEKQLANHAVANIVQIVDEDDDSMVTPSSQPDSELSFSLPFTQYLAQHGIENDYSDDISLTLIDQFINEDEAASNPVDIIDALSEPWVEVENVINGNVEHPPQPNSPIIEENDVLPERLVVVEAENNIIRSPSPPPSPMILSQGVNDIQQPSGSEVDVELNIITPPLPHPPATFDPMSIITQNVIDALADPWVEERRQGEEMDVENDIIQPSQLSPILGQIKNRVENRVEGGDVDVENEDNEDDDNIIPPTPPHSRSRRSRRPRKP